MAAVEENQALKQQFLQLQEQQQRKLQRRKQLKDDKDKKVEKSGTVILDTKSSIAFGVEDDLGLKTMDPPEKNGSMYSEELVEHLNDQLREMKDETGRLYKLLSERDLELRRIRKKREEEQLSGTGPVAGDAAATKIVDLSKKVRELTSELESERTKFRQAAKKCLDLEGQLKTSRATQQGDASSPSKKSAAPSAMSSRLSIMDDGSLSVVSDDMALKTVQDKLKQTELKLTENRNQSQSLRNELKMAHKVLQQEVGEGATVQSLMNASSGWRGRAQQVISLQKKVNELRSQVDTMNHSGSGGGVEEEMLGGSTRRSNMEDRHRDQLRKMDREKKEAQEKMVNELKALEQDYETLKQKNEASKARNKVLSTEIKSHKQQMAVLMDKAKHDDELIQALLKQQTQMKNSIAENSKQQQHHSQTQEQTMRQLSQKQQKENNIIDQLQAIVADKEGKLQALEHEINSLRLSNLQQAQINGVGSLFEDSGSHSDRPSSQGDRPATGLSSRPSTGRTAVLLAEVESMDDRTPTPAPPSRMSDVGGAMSRQATREDTLLSDPPSSRKGSARGSSRGPPSASSRPPSSRVDPAMLDELRLQCQEYKSLCQAATVERDRLTQLVQVLQKRSDELTQKSVDAQTELQVFRRKNVTLEKQIGKARIDQGQSARKMKSKSVVSLRESVALDEDLGLNQLSLEELEVRLDIQKDENEALKAALQSTLHAKEEDLQLYNDMIEETKKVFLQGLRQYRSQTVS